MDVTIRKLPCTIEIVGRTPRLPPIGGHTITLKIEVELCGEGFSVWIGDRRPVFCKGVVPAPSVIVPAESESKGS